MKAFFHFTAPLLALVAMVACTELEVSEEANDSINNGILQELSITGKDFQFEEVTRSSVTIGESGASFTWDEDDVIGIFPDKGDQVSFAMDEGAGTQTATFSGGGWALKSSAKYAAYYPHVYENRDMTKIPVSYVGQTQNVSSAVSSAVSSVKLSRIRTISLCTGRGGIGTTISWIAGTLECTTLLFTLPLLFCTCASVVESAYAKYLGFWLCFSTTISPPARHFSCPT